MTLWQLLHVWLKTLQASRQKGNKQRQKYEVNMKSTTTAIQPIMLIFLLTVVMPCAPQNWHWVTKGAVCSV